MRTSRLLLTIVVLIACSIFLIGMSEKIPKIEEIEVIWDTWSNQDYNLIENKYAKIKFRRNKTWVTYNTTSSKELLKKGTYTVIDGWNGDGFESTYFKVVRTTDDGIQKYKLYRFTELYEYGHFGRVLEIVSSTADCPTEINPNDSTYSILYLAGGGTNIGTFLGVMVLLILALIV